MASKIDNITNIPDVNRPGKTEAEVDQALERYIKDVSSSGQKPIPGASISKFFELTQNVVWSRQNTENIPECKRLLVLGDDPPDEEEINTEAITFYLASREPGQHGRGPVGSNTVKEVTHHVRSIQQHPEHPSEKLVTMGRKFDNYVVFNIYARTDSQSLNRVLWFENVMDSFRWYFRVNRLLVLFQRTERIGTVQIGELSLSKYSVTFYVSTEDTYQFGSQELKRIALNIDIKEV